MGSDFSKTPGVDGSTPKRMERREPSGTLFRPVAALLGIVLLTTALCSCGKSDTASVNGSAQTKATPKQLTDFEQKLQYVRDGQFNHIYVFSRRDGGSFDKEDVAYLTANSPVGEKTNMRVKTEDGRRVVIGTNFEFTQENFDALSKRFQIEDYTGK